MTCRHCEKPIHRAEGPSGRTRTFGICLQCRRAGHRAYHAANREAINARKREYYLAHLDTERARRWAWYRAHLDVERARRRAASRVWYRANRLEVLPKLKAQRAKRRADARGCLMAADRRGL